MRQREGETGRKRYSEQNFICLNPEALPLHPDFPASPFFPTFLLCSSSYSTLIFAWLNEQLNSKGLLCRAEDRRRDGTESKEEEEEEDGEGEGKKKVIYAEHFARLRSQPFNSLSSEFKSLTCKTDE